MVETTSVREEKPKLSARDRLCLIQTINALPVAQFEELVFALKPPSGVVASNTAPQGQRSKDLLDWLEGSSGPGLEEADEVLQDLIPKAKKTAPQLVAFVMRGKVSSSTASEIRAYIKLLSIEIGDDSIDIIFYEEGSIKVILNGSPEGLAKLQEMFEAGELENLDIPQVEVVFPIDSQSSAARKARLIQALQLRGLSSGKAIINLDDKSSKSDLRRADLRGANLRKINLTGVELTGADLTYADVAGTVFDKNPELVAHQIQLYTDFYLALLSRSSDDSSTFPFIRSKLLQFELWPQYDETAILQEVFIRTITKIHEGRTITNPSAWTCSVAYRYIRELSRSQVRYTQPSDDYIELLSVEKDAEQWFLTDQIIRVRSAFNRLLPSEQLILSLKVIQNKSWAEIQSFLREKGYGDHTVQALRKRKHRILLKLRGSYSGS